MLYALHILMTEDYNPINTSHTNYKMADNHSKYRHVWWRAGLFSVFILLIVFSYNLTTLQSVTCPHQQKIDSTLLMTTDSSEENCS